ncbi:MAG: hypothetical protein GYA58_04020 [Anaerolineaceae bacterium]|nr:hypothetical protein [Anaerolineaceae bacterium]
MNVIDSFLLSGVGSNIAHDIIKSAWEKISQKTWEEMYINSFRDAFNDMRPQLYRYADGDISINSDEIQKLFRQDFHMSVDIESLSALSAEEFSNNLGRILFDNQVIIIGGNQLSKDDYSNLIFSLIKKANSIFRKSIVQNDILFRDAVLKEASGNNTLLSEIQNYLSVQFSISTEMLSNLDKKSDTQIAYFKIIEDEIILIKEFLYEKSGTEYTTSLNNEKQNQGGGNSLPLTLDNVGFPMIWIEPINAYIHCFPITKIQFEYFLVECVEEGAIRWYENALKLNGRITPFKINPGNFWKLFFTGIKPGEAEIYTSYCGENYDIPTSEEWITAYHYLANLPHQSDIFLNLPLQHRCAIVCEKLLEVISKLNSATHLSLADEMLFNNGIMEWTKFYNEGRMMWAGVGKANLNFQMNIKSSTDIELPVKPNSRMRHYGFRLLYRPRKIGE